MADELNFYDLQSFTNFHVACLAEMNEYMHFYRDIPAFAIWS